MESVKKQIRNSMLEDILGQGELILNQLPSIEKQIAKAVESYDFTKLHQVYMAGCGDSYYAGEVVCKAFQKYAGMEAKEIEAYEFVAYEHEYLKSDSLMIAVSISGQVGTTLTTIDIAKEMGMRTMGINATPGSKIYDTAETVVDIGVRVKDLGPVPQTYHYLGNMTALFVLSLQIGLVKGLLTKDEYDLHMSEIRENLEKMGSSAKKLLEPIMNTARKMLGKTYTYVGGGSNFYTAAFGVAKLHEAACMGGMHQETEEWAHVQYFGTDDNTFTVVLAPKGKGYDRSVKIIGSVNSLGTPLAVVTDEGNEDAFAGMDVWSVAMSTNEIFSVMSLKLPLEIFAYSISELLDIRPFNYDNEVRKKTCEQTIYSGGVSAEEVARRQKNA